MSAVLRAAGLTVSAAGQEILHGVDIEIPAGRRTAIIGPNGAGKTTLLRALAGLNPHYTGTIELAGRELHSYTARELARVRAILPQERAAAAGLTVRELVAYGRFAHTGRFSLRTGAADRDAVTWAMEMANVAAFAARDVHTLSGGERQRVFLAMALSQKPRLLLLDEPPRARPPRCSPRSASPTYSASTSSSCAHRAAPASPSPSPSWGSESR